MKFTLSFLLLIVFLIPFSGSAQINQNNNASCMNESFDKKVKQLLSFSVPVMDVDELKQERENVIILDAREKAEYDISHIAGAQYIGYDHFDNNTIQPISKDAKIVVYCSVGYRSEKIGERLQKMGYTNVYNLYGSIFEWANRGYALVDKEGNKTSQIHTYNKKWSQWVEEGKAEKIW